MIKFSFLELIFLARQFLNWFSVKFWGLQNSELKFGLLSGVPETNGAGAYFKDVWRISVVVLCRIFFVTHSLGGKLVWRLPYRYRLQCQCRKRFTSLRSLFWGFRSISSRTPVCILDALPVSCLFIVWWGKRGSEEPRSMTLIWRSFSTDLAPKGSRNTGLPFGIGVNFWPPVLLHIYTYV